MELNGSTVEKAYIYANGQIIAQHDGAPATTNKYFYLHDRLGSVRQIINYADSQVNVKNRYTYKPFGELFDQPGEDETEETVTNSFKFTGQYYDDEIGQYYLRARQYDPYLARFTARDPVFGKFEEPLTLQMYLYCLNDPTNLVDPMGLRAYYMVGGFMASMGVSAAGQAGIVWDDKGNWGIITIASLGGGWPSISGGVYFGATSAKDILDLRGYGWSAGGSYSWKIVGGAAQYIWSNKYKGIEFAGSIGVSPPYGAEGHFYRTYTTVVRLESTTLTVERVLQAPLHEAFAEAETYGDWRWLLHVMVMTDVDLYLYGI